MVLYLCAWHSAIFYIRKYTINRRTEEQQQRVLEKVEHYSIKLHYSIYPPNTEGSDNFICLSVRGQNLKIESEISLRVCEIF